MKISKETAEFLLGMLGSCQLSAKDPDLVKNAQTIANAQNELIGYLGYLDVYDLPVEA